MIKNKIIIFLLFLIFYANNHCLSKPAEQKLYGIISSDFNDFVNDFGIIGNQIYNINLNNLACVGGIATGTGLLFLADENIRKNVQNNLSKSLDDYFYYPNEIGGKYSVGFPVIFYLSGLIAKDKDLRTTGRLMAEAFLLAGVVNQTLKIGFGRARPFLNKGNSVFEPFSFKDPYFSLPSGHCSAIFSITTVFAFKYNKWWSYSLGYSLAVSTALARVYYDKHWTSDIFLGSAIGLLSGIAIINAYEKNLSLKKKNLSLSIYPNGINFNYKF